MIDIMPRQLPILRRVHFDCITLHSPQNDSELIFIYYQNKSIQIIWLDKHYITFLKLCNLSKYQHSTLKFKYLLHIIQIQRQMPSLKTNYIRTDINSQCFRYQFQLVSNQPIDSKYYHEIQGYLLTMNEFIVFSYPFVYSVDQMKQLKSFNFMLSNGQKVQVIILVHNTITLNSKDISAEIHKQLMKGTNFLYSEKLQICLNPFQQRKVDHTTSLMPGFSLNTQAMNNCVGFYLVPIQAKITQFHSLSSLHEHSMILDYNSGSFYQKSSIVRYDKVRQVIHFRTGEQLSKDSLKSLEILPLSGFQLALRLTNYFKRIKDTQKLKKLIQKWQIKFDSRFMQLPYNFFPVSHILARNNQQKSLGQVLGSISSYNFEYNFRKAFQKLTFDDSIRANIYFLVPKIQQSIDQNQNEAIDVQSEGKNIYTEMISQQEQFLLSIISEFESLKLRMNLEECNIQVFTYGLFPGWVNGTRKTIQLINEFIQKEKARDSVDRIFVLSNTEELLREGRQTELGGKLLSQKQNPQPIYKEIVKNFVSSGTYYHLINARDNQFKSSNDIIALKSLATIYTKLRLNPWRIKQIPFGTKPLMAFSLHVKLQTNGQITVGVVGTLNAFLSKYTSSITKCRQQQYRSTIVLLIKQSIEKFKSIHRVTPIRVMVFRSGDFTGLSPTQLQLEVEQLENVLIALYSCKPTYILLDSQSPLRVYNQIDFNYISKDTVKPTQLLCQLKYNNERYVQLQTDRPFYKITVLGEDKQDPYFQEKVIQLTTKLCFTYQLMTQMRFGKGLGFLSYAERLCRWAREFNNLQSMESHLKQGLLMFL